MVRQGVWVVACSLALAVGSGSCGDDTDSRGDGSITSDLAVSDTAQADALHDAPTADAPVDVPSGADAHPAEDASQSDAPYQDTLLDDSGLTPFDAPQFQDAPYPTDSMPQDGPLYDSGLQSCTTHCDCPQEWFCYYGKCIKDLKIPVYCCAKAGCPPGLEPVIGLADNRLAAPARAIHDR